MRHPLSILYLLLTLLYTLTACDTFTSDPPPTPTATLPIPTDIPTADPPTQTPTNTPTPIPTATATPNPELADWTIMVYMNADNNLESAALLNINEMEAAGTSPNINLLVQIDRTDGHAIDNPAIGDWTDTRRYQITADQDPTTITSPIRQELGETNMGSPETLSDFITWSATTYPANRYALIIWDHGTGWSGISFDDTNSDQLTLTELSRALDTSLQATDLPQLDIIGFDACLMGQLEVYAALAPYARYAVGSEELTPGRGWNYRALLEWLYESPNPTNDQLATAMVDTFLTYYEQVAANNFVTMSAVDLTHIPAVVNHLNTLATTLSTDFTFAAPSIGDARSGAETYAHAYGADADLYAAIDLHHFASILGDQSLDPAVQTATADLTAAIDNAVLTAGKGLAFTQAHGIALYFPRTAAFYQPAYANESPLSTWDSFLTRYHTTGTDELSPPQVQIARSETITVSAHYPAHLSFQLTGRSIEEVVLLGGQYQEDGRRLLTEYDPLIPEPTYLANGDQLSEWRDGLHEDFYVWNSRVTYLTDGITSDAVIMWPSYDRSLRTVEGQYTPLAGASQPFEARLTFDRTTQKLTAVWGFTSDGSPFEVTPQPGDVFQAYRFYLEPDDTLSRTLGTPFQIDPNGQLFYEWQPVPDGQYFLGFEARNTAGQIGRSFIDLPVQNSTLPTNALAYLDPYLGYQFLYPQDWYRPEYRNGALFTTNISGTTALQITLYPDLTNTTPLDLKQETLQRFGDIDILFEDEAVLGSYGALRTAYGYTDPNGQPHTGLFITLVQEDLGFVIDLDGFSVDETATLAAVDQLVSSWQFRPAGVGLFPGRWATVTADGFTLPQPADFQRDSFREWTRFLARTDPRIFVALRAEPAAQPAENTLTFWAGEAARGVAEYEAGTTGRYLLGGKQWLRQDFTYQTSDGQPIWGFVMVTEQANQQITAWVEAPADLYNDLESTIFEVMLADLNLR